MQNLHGLDDELGVFQEIGPDAPAELVRFIRCRSHLRAAAVAKAGIESEPGGGGGNRQRRHQQPWEGLSRELRALSQGRKPSLFRAFHRAVRSEERRVGKEVVSPGRSRWS